MEIEKNARENEYANVSTSHIFDKNLSSKAKGIMTFLLLMPPGWNCSVEEISKYFTDGRDAVRASLAELERNGYLEKERIRQGGRYIGYRYKMYERAI